MPKETRIALKNIGLIDPENIQDYIDRGGYCALKKALNQNSEQITEEILRAGLRGRGGAGFSTGLKNRFASQNTPGNYGYVVCNADEGEPGTFKDRIIMEQDPHLLIEGMLIAGYAVSAQKGYIYIRGEYSLCIQRIQKAINDAVTAGFIGEKILGSNYSFSIEVKPGAGSYLCGEELTLLESLEGKRGYPRIKPPFPAEKGLWGKPTLINNVETLSHFPSIIENGAEWYIQMGTEKTPGTKIFTISGNVKKPGYVEVALGITLRSLIGDYAGGMKEGKELKAILLGGAAGTFVDASMLDYPLGYDLLKEKDATLGSGAVIVIDDQTLLTDVLKSILEFFKHESCGKCVPCRVGCKQLLLLFDRFCSEGDERLLTELEKQATMMSKTSLCPLGQSPILPVRSILRYFKHELILETQ